MSISIRDLVLVYGEGPTAVAALGGLELEVGDGELCIVRGPNGSGKTSLIRVLTGEQRQTAGSIRVTMGQDRAPRIAVVRQFDELQDALSVAEHCELFSARDALEHIDARLHHKRLAHLTAGERRIVAIGLAMSMRPDVLLADEPTGALPWPEAEALLRHLAELARAGGITVLLVSHDSRAEVIADRVVSLSDGRISAAWTPQETPQQVIDSRGWLQLPEDARTGLSDRVGIQRVDEGVLLHGSRSHAAADSLASPMLRTLGVPLLRVRDVTCERSGTCVVKGVSFEIAHGARMVVTGPSGSGKTTLLEAISGLRVTAAGTVDWLDAPKRSRPPMFSMDMPYAQHCTLRELIPGSDLVTQLHLDAIADRELRTFSGGQRQRALVAMALAQASPLVLLDEPTSALDDENAELVVEAIASSDKAFLIATHDPRLRAIATDELTLW